MKRLPVAGVLLGAVTAAGASGWQQDIIDVDIVDEYHHRLPTYAVEDVAYDTHRAYVEAVPHEHYAIRVRNRSGGRIGLVIAVDGRNVISGRQSHLRPGERMYVLGPYEQATYTGWRSARDRVNRFYFTDAADSYADRAFGDRSAMGVIAVAAFRERRVHRPPPQPWYEGHPGAGQPKGQERDEAMAKGGRSARPGTGYGRDEYSPSVRVHFEPASRAAARHFYKYEWREMLCRRGVAACQRRQPNRFWDDDADYGFAPPPPRRPQRWRWPG